MSGRVEVTTVPKPWGHETIWAKTDRYVGKILHIKAGHALSVQYHNRKDETVYLLSGVLKYWVATSSARAVERRTIRLANGGHGRDTGRCAEPDTGAQGRASSRSARRSASRRARSTTWKR